jgi:hypothetical protein
MDFQFYSAQKIVL